MANLIPPVVLWIPGALANPQGTSRGGTWHKRARLARSIRERVAMHVLAKVGRRAPWPLSTPKRVTFRVYTHNTWDSDTLTYACKPYRDALMDLAIFGHATTKGSGDHASLGHVFRYEQEVCRGKGAKRGVSITVAPLARDDGERAG